MVTRTRNYGVIINNNQLERVKEKIQINTDDFFVVDDNLELGYLRIFQPVSNSIIIQEVSDIKYNTDIKLVGEVIINDFNMDESRIWIHNIECEKGFENLIEPMMKRIISFIEKYGILRISTSSKIYKEYYDYVPPVWDMFIKDEHIRGLYHFDLIPKEEMDYEE